MTKEEYISSRYDEYFQYWANVALRFGPLVVLLLIPLDYIASPANFRAFLAYRFCTAAFLFLLYLVNKRTTNRKRINIAFMLAATTVSIMLALMLAKFGGHQSSYAPGFILVGIFVSGIVPLSLGYCLVSSVIVYSLYLIPILLYDSIINISHFISESIIIFACIATMLILRYIGNKRLFHELKLQYDIEQYKISLEEKVTERTQQLSFTIMHLEQEVHEREEAEKRLIEGQEVFRRIADNAPLAISMINREGTIEYVNKKHTEIMGYTTEDISTIEQWWSHAYSDADIRERVRREWPDIVDHLFSGEELQGLLRRIVCKDGTVKDIEMRLVAAADHIIVAFDDITERKKTEDLIRQSRDDWEDTFNTINDAITIHDSDFNIIRANSAAERMLGKNAADIFRNKCFRSYHGTDKAPEGCPSCMSLQSGKSSLTELFEPHLNKYLEIKALPRIDRAGALIGIIHIVRDITEKKEIEYALSEQQHFASNLIENSPVATFVLDSHHQIMLWNRACEELTGCRADEMIATSDQWKPFYPAKRPTVADVILDKETINLAALYPNYSRSALNPLSIKAEGWYKNLGGKDRYIAFEASPIYNNSQTMIAAIETLQDITQSKRLEEQLLQAQKIEAIGQLAGGVAHDFNNILTAIVGYAHLTLLKMTKDDPLKINVEQILQASDKAAALTQSLLAFSRKQIMNPKPVNLNEIVKRLEMLLKRLIREDIHISTLWSNEDLTVFVDAGQIEQVLMNLVTNARDAMPEGGQIVIKTEAMLMDHAFIDLHGYGKAGRYGLLTVSDSGEGMDAKTREKIFEPFFTTKEQGKGTGLGLAMVYGIVKQHEGFIDVWSERGKGTSFSIYLPLSAGSVEMKEAREEAVAVRGGTETVLLAEDDGSLRKLFSTILRNQGYSVIEAKDGEEAIQLFGKNSGRIQLLILDGIMPKKNGREALEEIRLINPSVKAIFVSGYAEDIVSRQGLLEPGINFLLKPLSPSVLLKKLREVLDATD